MLYVICDRTWEKGPLRARIQNRVIGTEVRSNTKAITCGIFFVVKVTRCGVLAVNVQLHSSPPLQAKILGNVDLKYHFRCYSVIRNFDYVTPFT